MGAVRFYTDIFLPPSSCHIRCLIDSLWRLIRSVNVVDNDVSPPSGVLVHDLNSGRFADAVTFPNALLRRKHPYRACPGCVGRRTTHASRLRLKDLQPSPQRGSCPSGVVIEKVCPPNDRAGPRHLPRSRNDMDAQAAQSEAPQRARPDARPRSDRRIRRRPHGRSPGPAAPVRAGSRVTRVCHR